MRLSSEMFPFASHGEYGYDLEYADKELKAAGDLANKYGHRVTTHPGQVGNLLAQSPSGVLVLISAPASPSSPSLAVLGKLSSIMLLQILHTIARC